MADDKHSKIRMAKVKGTDFNIPSFGNRFKNCARDINGVRHWKCRPNDVFVCAYPKSGTHWIWETVCMIKAGKTERIILNKEVYMMEMMPRAMFENIKDPIVFNTHLPPQYLPEDIARNKCKQIYMLRNPKDTAVSNYHHNYNLMEFDGDWSSFYDLWLQGEVPYNCWFEYQRAWERHIADNPGLCILTVYYEDLQEDALREITRLANFLGEDCSIDFLDKVVKQCTFETMKNEKMKIPGKYWRTGESLMYRKGKVGDWKNWLTVAQNEMFDSIYEKKMKDSMLSFRYM